MAREALYPAEDEEEDYYSLSNFPGDRFSPGSEGAVAFDEPSAGGVRYPLASPATGGQVGSFGAPTSDWQRAIDEMIARDRPKADRQYNAEIARVDRNEIADAGSDPIAVQQAIRLQGLREMQRLIQDGASQSEAFRLAAPKLTFNHPAALSSAMHYSQAPQLGPITSQPVPGGTAVLNPNGTIHSVLKTPAPPKELKPAIPPDAKFAVADASAEVADVQHRIRSIQDEVAKGRMDQEEAAPALAELTKKLEDAQAKRMKLSTNWMNRAAVPNIVQQTAPSSIPKGAIDKLKKNPDLADDFDAMFGAGSAASVLGK